MTPPWGKGDPLKTTPASRHPFQFLVMVALMLIGITVVTQDATPGSIADLVAPWAVQLWGGTMMVGGAMAIAASYWPDRITGLLMERIALGGISGVSAVYAVAVTAAFHGTNGYLNSGIIVAISAACIWRIVQVNKELKRLAAMIGLHSESGE